MSRLRAFTVAVVGRGVGRAVVRHPAHDLHEIRHEARHEALERGRVAAQHELVELGVGDPQVAGDDGELAGIAAGGAVTDSSPKIPPMRSGCCAMRAFASAGK